MKPKTPITDVLRNAILQSGQTPYRISKGSGVTLLTILRFMRGQQSITIRKADLLAAYFGLELRERKGR